MGYEGEIGAITGLVEVCEDNQEDDDNSDYGYRMSDYGYGRTGKCGVREGWV